MLVANLVLIMRIENYVEKIRSLRPDQLKKGILACKIPEKSILIVADTETTGLDIGRDDEIHEVAIRAIDNNFEEIGFYHGKSIVSENVDPLKILDYARIILNNIFEEEEREKIIKKAIRRFAFVKGVSINYDGSNRILKGVEKTYQEATYNLLREHVDFNNWTPGDLRLKSLYNALKHIYRAYDIHWVLKLTRYNENDPEREGGQSELSQKILTFLRHTADINIGKNKLIIVGQNIGFDIEMMMKAMMVSGFKYTTYKLFAEFPYIDTANVMREHINKYLYCTWLFFYRKWTASSHKIANRTKRYLYFLKKIQPVTRNKLGYLTEYFNIKNDQWHSADNDILATTELLLIELAIDWRFKEACERNLELASILHEVENSKKPTARKITVAKEQELLSIVNKLRKKTNEKNVDEVLLEVKEIIDSINEKHAESAEDRKKAYKEMNFTINSNDPYREAHLSAFNKFIKSIKEDPMEYKVNHRQQEERGDEWNKKIKREFPGATNSFNLNEEWRERSIL